MKKKIKILFFLLLSINCQLWWGEINGHEIDDSFNGFAGSHPHKFSDFYLCSDRKYRVHFLNDNNTTWSEEFTACQPVGNCKQYIDGIAISGGKYYGGRISLDDPRKWLEETNEYNISNNGYTGQLGHCINGLYVFGDDYYGSGYKMTNCSNEKEISKNITRKLFGTILSTIYYNETEIYNNNTILITIQLLNINEINFKGKISIKFEKNIIINADWGGFIGNNIKKLLENTFNFKIDDIKSKIVTFFSKYIYNGDITITFNWPKKRIEIDVFTKIKDNYHGYRGGFRINIYLDKDNNENPEFLLKIKTICEYFLKYSGKNINMIKKLLSDCNSFERLNIIMNEYRIYSTLAEAIFSLLIISSILS